jgi:glycosyltransferase involved in cell wall biosynthesis
MELSIVSRKAGKKTAGKRRDLKQSGKPGNMPQKNSSGRLGNMTLEKSSGRPGNAKTAESAGCRKLVIIPAFNEEKGIELAVRGILEHAPDYDYLVINDCSKDRTLRICLDNGFHGVDLPINLGIGGAVQTGYRYAYEHGYEIAVQMDGDAQHDASYLKAMEEKLLSENCDMVIGSRFIEKQGFQSNGIRRAGIRWFAGMTRLFFGQRITDSTSGMRMCNRRVMELFVKDYPRDYPEPETVCRLLRHKMKVEEVPVVMHSRVGGKSSLGSARSSVYYMFKVTLAILIERLR